MLGINKKIGVENRLCKRIGFPYMAHVSSGDRHAIVSMLNLSVTGAKLKNSLELGVGDKLTVRPVIPSNRDRFVLDGVVVRKNDFDQSIGISSKPHDMAGLMGLITSIVLFKN